MALLGGAMQDAVDELFKVYLDNRIKVSSDDMKYHVRGAGKRSTVTWVAFGRGSL